MKSATQVLRARRRRGVGRGNSSGWVRLALALLTLVVILSGAAGVLTAYALAENIGGMVAADPNLLSFTRSGRETHLPVRFYDRDQSELLFEVLNPEAKSRRWYQLDPDGPILLPEHVIQASVAAQVTDYWTESSHPILQTLGAFRSLWFAQPKMDRDRSIVDLLADAQVLPLSINGDLDAGIRSFQHQLASAELEAAYSKVELLEFFMNTADYGNLAYGIDAAALVYFGRHAESLSLAESALLAPIPFDPEINPIDSPEQARERQRELLIEMRESGLISRTEAQRAMRAELDLVRSERSHPSTLEQFLIATFESRFGRHALGRHGLQILTTMDADLQKQSECVLAVQLGRLNDEALSEETAAGCLASELLPPLRPGDVALDHGVGEGALVVMDAREGELLALAGKVQSPRPVDSLGHAFIYLTAFAEGYSPGSMVLDLPPASSSERRGGPDEMDLDRYQGPVRIRTALVNGHRAAAEQMVELVGVESVLSTFKTMGVRVDRESGQTPDVWRASLLDLAHASTVFARNGVMTGLAVSNAADTVEPVVIREIVDDQGRLIYAVQPDKRAVLSDQLAFLINDVLSDGVARRARFGPSSPLEINRPAAATAALSESERDVWALGYTPELVVGVWMGSPDGAAPSGLTLRNSAAPVWQAIMKYAARDLEPGNWQIPPGVTRVEVCDPSGLLPTTYCPETVREPYISGTEPTTSDNLYQPYLVNKETGKLATLSTPVELVEERVYLVPPPEAAEWARAVGFEKPPQEYDTLMEAELPDPGLRITAPAPFAFLRGEVRVRGYVDIEGLDFYRLQVGRGLNPLNWLQLGEDRTSPVRGGVLAEWDTSELSGLYTLQIIAVEADGQVYTALVHVTVDNELPVGEVVYPQQGQVFSGSLSDELALHVEAQDGFDVERVVFFVDGEEVGHADAEPFSIRWRMRSSGSHTVYAEVFDLAGNKVLTEEVSFEIVRP